MPIRQAKPEEINGAVARYLKENPGLEATFSAALDILDLKRRVWKGRRSLYSKMFADYAADHEIAAVADGDGRYYFWDPVCAAEQKRRKKHCDTKDCISSCPII